MATTTNYSWTTPDDTALVKDGAAAIRTLGSSVDTTTKNLNPSTTLGDIEYRSSTANVNTRLGVGSSGQVLTVASGVPSWATPAVGGGITLISTTSFSGGTFSLTSIPSTYKYLKLVCFGVGASAENDATIRFNNDSGSNYDSDWWRNTGGLGGGFSQSGTSFYIGTIPANTDANKALSFILDIPNYASTAVKPFFASGWGANSSSARTGINMGRYRGTSAIDRIDVIIGSGTYSAGTALLYGEN
jgi:hypothetical protein